MSHRFDLHCHSIHSDGTSTPVEIVRMAARSKLSLLALTDHDNMDGIVEATEAGRELGVPVLPAVEMDNEWRHELHIIGLDVDPTSRSLLEALEIARARREKRNKVIYAKLLTAGMDIRPIVNRPDDHTTKLHIAMALCSAGYAADVRDAFARYLRQGQIGYYVEPRFTPQQVLSIIHASDGVPVLAHPCHIRDNPHTLVHELVSLGLMGLEAYYPSSTPKQTEMFVSLAAQYKLLVTCGSDYHGANRPGVPLGCAWRDCRELERTYTLLSRRMQT